MNQTGSNNGYSGNAEYIKEKLTEYTKATNGTIID